MLFSIFGRLIAHIQKTEKRSNSQRKKNDGTKKINQKWKELKNFDNCFSVIFSCYDQSLVSGRKTGH